MRYAPCCRQSAPTIRMDRLKDDDISAIHGAPHRGVGSGAHGGIYVRGHGRQARHAACGRHTDAGSFRRVARGRNRWPSLAGAPGRREQRISDTRAGRRRALGEKIHWIANPAGADADAAADGGAALRGAAPRARRRPECGGKREPFAGPAGVERAERAPEREQQFHIGPAGGAGPASRPTGRDAASEPDVRHPLADLRGHREGGK